MPGKAAPKEGKRYRALVGFDYCGDEAIHRRLLKGEGAQIPWEERGMVRVEAGEVFSAPAYVIEDLFKQVSDLWPNGPIEEVE